MEWQYSIFIRVNGQGVLKLIVKNVGLQYSNHAYLLSMVCKHLALRLLVIYTYINSYAAAPNN